MSSPATASASDASPRQEQHDQEAEAAGASFAMEWQATDTSSLQPAHLPCTRVPRAWERKPLSPYSRQKMRVGKVWKRAAPVEIRRRRSVGAGMGGAKPVKKMRLDDDGAVGVARWEGEGEVVGSPARKIVLRRDRVGDEGLLELPDEEVEVGGEVEDGATVEVFDEDGTLLDVDPEAAQGQQDWEDEEDEFHPTMMHLGDIIEQARQQFAAPQASENGEQRDLETAANDIGPRNDAGDAPEPAPEQSQLEKRTFQPAPTVQPQEVVLPDGFVSPVKREAEPTRRPARKSVSSRRRTLPTEWKPSRLRQMALADEQDEELDDAVAEPDAGRTHQEVDDANEIEPPHDSHQATATETEQEWEDIEDEVETHLDTEMDGSPADETKMSGLDDPETEGKAPVSIEEAGMQEAVSPGTHNPDNERVISPVKLPSSPVPSIDGQHPRLPLRRSPRRKSSSPVKQSSIRPSTEHPHLVAFTPIRSLLRLSALTQSPLADEEPAAGMTEENASPMLERSVSAPPEEPAMSPHRPARPRVSDDTALLQAFLNRAAESKNSGRRMSATKREAMTNRRDSDTVRQALSSPAKPEVLADLDPNSPSPHKPAAIASDEIDDANILPEPEPSPLQKTRRSGRSTRKAAPQTATPTAAPNKISIRGNSDNVVLKKTEAQELSQLTRTNTRKNKGGAILPLYRLAKLQQQGVVDPLDDGTVVEEKIVPKPNSKGRALRWNQTLVEVWQGGDVSETSLLSDELSGSGPTATEDSKMEVEAEVPQTQSAPPPPSETPSKPKIRRLKAPRTAATPAKGPAASVGSAAKPEAAEGSEPAAPEKKPEKKAPAPAKRRTSRIATPAKSLGNSSFLPADLEPPAPAPQSTTSQQAQKKSIPTPTAASGRRKAPPATKLPGPSSSTSTSSTALGQGKENLIASPPKKKPNAPPSAKAFAPKLDFGKSLAPSSQEDVQSAPPGLASPAKKVGRKGTVMFAPGAGQEGEGRERSGADDLPPGLKSPAKKRTRRAVAAAGGRV